jgi:hypothetical protein
MIFLAGMARARHQRNHDARICKQMSTVIKRQPVFKSNNLSSLGLHRAQDKVLTASQSRAQS